MVFSSVISCLIDRLQCANFGQIYELLRFYDFRKAVAIAFLGILKTMTVNSLLFVQKVLFFDDTNLCHEKLDLG